MAGDTGEMAQRQMSLKCQDWDSDPWVKCAPCFCQSSGEPAPRGSWCLLSGQASENTRAGKATSKTTELRSREGTSLAQGKPGTARARTQAARSLPSTLCLNLLYLLSLSWTHCPHAALPVAWALLPRQAHLTWPLPGPFAPGVGLCSQPAHSLQSPFQCW